jgi:hypothetical protein
MESAALQRWATAPIVMLAIAAVAGGCGGGSESGPAQPAQSSGWEQPPPPEPMEVEGLMGTIPERKIHATLEPKLGRFQRCFFHGAEDVEFIGGDFEFYFRVGLDGRVEWVYPRSSTVGHRGTEECLLQEAARVRFPEPRGGGAAELAWGFGLDPAAGRPPVDWEASRVAQLVASEGPGVTEACGGGPFHVTAYVAPGGQVMAAGAAVDDADSAGRIDCVVEAVRGWSMPDPGSYAAKVSFDL